MLKALTLSTFKDFLQNCSKAFASKEEVKQNDDDLNYYVLEISESEYNELVSVNIPWEV